MSFNEGSTYLRKLCAEQVEVFIRSIKLVSPENIKNQNDAIIYLNNARVNMVRTSVTKTLERYEKLNSRDLSLVADNFIRGLIYGYTSSAAETEKLLKKH